MKQKKFAPNAQLGQDAEDEATESEIDITNNATKRILQKLKKWRTKKTK